MQNVTEFLKTLAGKGVKLSAEAGQLKCYARGGVLTDDLRKEILHYKKDILALLDRLQRPVIAPAEVVEFPLAAGQKGLYILQKVHPAMTAYNLPLCVRISGDANVAVLQRAWSAVLDQHPLLTARIAERDGALVHVLDPACRTAIHCEEVAFDDDASLIAFLRTRVKRAFDLDRGPLHRVELFTTAPREYVLLITIHHMIFDGVSAVVLLRSLLSAYQQLSDGRPLAAPADPAGYAAFVTWEESMLASKDGRAHAEYWDKQLSGELPSLELFPDRPKLASPSFEGASVIEVLPVELARSIRELARARSVLPSVVFLSALDLLLHRYTNQEEVVVGMPVAVRPGQTFAAQVGYFINMVPLRTRLAGMATLGDLLRSVQRTMLDGVFHAAYPFELMLDRLRAKQGTKNAVFQVNYAYQNFISDESFSSLLPKGDVQVRNVPEIGPEGYSDLGFEIFEKDASFSVHIRYNPELYAHDAIARLAGHYAALLGSMTADGDRALHEYSIVTPAEQHRLLVELNATDAPFPEETCIHDFFEEQVARRPHAPAATFGGETLSYQQLDARCRDLALFLQDRGIGRDAIVGLCLERSLEMMVGIHGTVIAGGAYLPLDPDYPNDRLTYMLQDSSAKVVLTQEKFRARIAALAGEGTLIVSLDTEWPGVVARAEELKAAGVALRREVGPLDVCYVIYTSGSTGKPKGALIEHRSLVNRLHWMQKMYPIGEGDVVLQKTPYSFDVSVWEFFWPMMTGAAVVFAVPDGHRDVRYLETLIEEAGVTTLHFVPSMFRAYLDEASAPRGSVRRIFASGEALDRQSVERYRTAFPRAELHNLYGPTEAAIDVTAFDCSQLATPFVPIGKPIDNIQIHILDAHGQPQPIGVPGELHIAGVGLARGYLNRPELTCEKFVANPFAPGARMYKTGDLACWMDDGNIQYLGRIDTQVKIRGLRVEIGEIEARLNEHSQVADSAVIAAGEGADKRLIAFYRASGSTAGGLVEIDAAELRAHLAQTLPDYMVPAAFVSLAAIPLSASGKADRRALARIEVTAASARPYVAPRNETERELVALWAEVLDVPAERIGVEDDFFELGGHSLRAAQLVAKIRARLGAEIPLKAFFDGGSVAAMTKFLGVASDLPPIERIDRSRFERLPLSFAQERLWFIHQLEPESAGYHLPGAIAIHGPLDADALERAFATVIARHENLRTVFPSAGGRAEQRILDSLEFRLDRREVRDRDEAARLCRADAVAPFDLANGPLLRAKVLRVADDEHILVLNMHHIISDGWSIGVLVHELRTILAGGALPPLPIQYADYSVWQRQWLEGGALETQLAYWRQKLDGVPESLDLATDFARPGVQSFAGARRPFTLDAALTARLKQLGEQRGATLFMTLLAVFKTLLHRYSGQDDLCVGTPIANRRHAETEGLIGMFVNTLALRTCVGHDDPFGDVLARVKTTCLEAYEHQDTPFERIVDAVRPQRNMAVSPIFQTMLILQNVDMGAPDPHVRRLPLDAGISKFDLTFELTETESGLTGEVEYSTALYQDETIARMIGHFAALCRAVVNAPEARIADLDFLGEAEREQLIAGFNDTKAEFPSERCIHSFFEERVSSYPDRIAVRAGDDALTYRELHERATTLARILQSRGIGPDDIVGLCVERSIEMMVGILGTVMAGGAYMPLDPSYPDERLTYMLADSSAKVVLTQGRFQGRIRALSQNDAAFIALDGTWPEASGELRRDVAPHHLCYVIYTSGSTGKPKGVLNEHRGLVNRLNWMQKMYPIGEGDVVLQKTPYSFDVSVWEFFWPMMTGASVVFAAPEGHKDVAYLEGLINDAHVTTLHYVPSMLLTFLENARGACPSVRQVFCSGEALDKKAVDRYRTRFPNAALHNLYGPTEAAIDVTSYDCTQLEYPFVPIGRPIDNTQIYILDRNDRPQPVGVPGELHIAGANLARGYLNRPELTAEKFVANPFAPDARMYKTGDLARWLPDGNIQYLGRIDTQVKIRGFRIELGEIESRLNAHPAIQDSVVVAQGEGEAKRLVAFFRAIAEVPSHDELRAHLAQALPEYMIPAAFVSLPAIPLNSNGKADRNVLARMDVTFSATREYVAPRNETEARLAEIFASVLGVAPHTVGIHDSFFELGGHSLLATQLVSQVREVFGADVPLRAVFERSTIAQLAELLGSAARSDVAAIAPVDRARYDRLPLSFAQERLWFLHQLEPASAGYNVPAAVTIRGALDVDALEGALRQLIGRHESLRTVFLDDDGQAYQQIVSEVAFHLDRVDLRGYDDARQEAERLCRADAATPFDLTRGPLLRVKAIRVGDEEHLLSLNLHHIVSDGWSIGVLIRELGAILAGRTLAPLPIQYADYAIWQRQWLGSGGALERQLAYWQQQLAGVPERLDLPTDRPRPGVHSYAGATHLFTLDAALTARLARLADGRGATLYMLLLAALDVLLHRYSGQADFCVGSPIANRNRAETEGLVGMFVNTLALRARVDGERPFLALFDDVRATCLEAYESQDAPFEKVVDLVRPQRNMAVSPIFQVMLVLQNLDLGIPDGRIEPHRIDSGISKFDLTFELTQNAGGLSGAIEYSTALFDAATIERMAAHFQRLLHAIVESPEARIADLDFLGEAEREQLIAGFNDTHAEFPSDRCIHSFFEERVASYPDRIAVRAGDDALTYRELHDRATTLARILQSRGIGPDDIVGLCVERSVEMMIGILGTVMAGGAYMPLDPSYPDERLTYMLADSSAKVVLTQGRFEGRIRALSQNDAAFIALDGAWPEAAGELRRDVAPQNLCYVIYTSGSTGKPKGVLNEHRGLVNRLNWMQKMYPIGEGDVVLQKTPYSFDVSVWEFFWPMMTGASVVFAAPEGHKDVAYLEGLINDAQVTTLHYVPSMLLTFLENARGACPSVRQVFCSGEALDKKAVDRYRSRFPNAALHNLYGPTEAAIDVTSYDCTQLEYPFVPIGRPIDNTQIYILDRNDRPQPVGVPGELHIAGANLARGYLNRPELTSEKFVANPFAPDARMYKTGDLARWLPDGNIQYLGRIDTQVKIRGFRIELGEIESRLNAHPAIQDSVVVAQGQGEAKRLVAFFRAIAEAPSHDELRAHLAQALPEYMIPAAFVSLPAIPLNSNGKADRNVLAKMDVTLSATREYVAPRNETERRLAASFAEVLEISPDSIGVHDGFFDLGGHSLTAIRLITRVNREFARTLPLAVLFTAPTVAALANLLDVEEALPFEILVPIQPYGNATPLFAVPGGGGNTLSLRPLARTVGDDQPLYGLQGAGSDGKSEPHTTIEQAAIANLAAVRSVQPHGPYRLAGHSYGGVVAFEMARLLLEQGEEVASLVLLDTAHPSHMRFMEEAEDIAEACQELVRGYGVELDVDMDRLRRSTIDENARYMTGLLAAHGIDVDSQQFATFVRVSRANRNAYRAYRPPQLPRAIDVTLHRAIHAPDFPSLPADYGWNQALRSPARVCDVDADHYTILSRADVRSSADALA